MTKKNTQLFAFLIILMSVVASPIHAQQWQAGAEIGTSFISSSDFEAKDGLRTTFFSPGVFVKHKVASRWWIQVNGSFTRFDYYKNGTTYEEANTYQAAIGIGRSFLSDKLTLDVGFGLIHWKYFLNDFKSTHFSAAPMLEYQCTNPKKSRMNISCFVRYPIGFQKDNPYGWLTTGIRMGGNWNSEK